MLPLKYLGQGDLCLTIAVGSLCHYLGNELLQHAVLICLQLLYLLAAYLLSADLFAVSGSLLLVPPHLTQQNPLSFGSRSFLMRFQAVEV